MLGGIAAALLYENVFAVNASLSKAKGFLLATDYNPADYEPNKEQPVEVCCDVKNKYANIFKMVIKLSIKLFLVREDKSITLQIQNSNFENSFSFHKTYSSSKCIRFSF